MDFRKVYDTIPEQFDRWRPRYCRELFDTVIGEARIGVSAAVLEIGPGTGQATEPFLRTGCDYLGVELGENFAAWDREKFGAYRNFHIVNADFETFDFGARRFDLVFSAATIQWIPKRTAFPKVFGLLKSGGTLVMFMTRTDEKTPNGALYDEIQQVYDAHFYVDASYHCRMNYENAVNYGFTNFRYRDWKENVVYTADEYVAYLAATQIGHITLREPYKTAFYEGVRAAVRRHGDRITLSNTIALYLAQKP